MSRTRAAWEQQAAGWIEWARSPELDHTFWGFNLPALLRLVPPPGRLTVDVGCGEGRVARELIRRGHTVVGVEGSEALAAAARAAQPRSRSTSATRGSSRSATARPTWRSPRCRC